VRGEGNIDARDKALKIAATAFEKKAFDIVVLEVREILDYADYFVLVSGASEPQVRAIADEVLTTLKAAGERPLHVDGVTDGRWAVLDFGDVVCHVFQLRVREYYELERLWAMAPEVDTGLPETRRTPEQAADPLVLIPEEGRGL